jgi:ribonuclease HI
LESTNWTIEFAWVKANVGIYGKEVADHLARAAACSTELAVIFDRSPKCTLYSEIYEEATQKWQQEWERCTKAAVTKQFLPNIRNWNKLNINIKPTFTAMVTVHGKTRAYLQRFKQAESAIYPCNKQTLDHILNCFALFHTQRNTLKKNDTATGRQVKGS